MKRTPLVLLVLFVAVSAFAEEELMLAQQKRTMADMRSLAISVEAYATDHNKYPNVSLERLEQLISPVYIKYVPTLDAWLTQFFYIADDADQYRFVSAGADGTFEAASRQLGPPVTEGKGVKDPNADIIFQDGMFIQYPEALKPASQRPR